MGPCPLYLWQNILSIDTYLLILGTWNRNMFRLILSCIILHYLEQGFPIFSLSRTTFISFLLSKGPLLLFVVTLRFHGVQSFKDSDLDYWNYLFLLVCFLWHKFNLIFSYLARCKSFVSAPSFTDEETNRLLFIYLFLDVLKVCT